MAKDKILKPFIGIIAPDNKFTVDTIDDLKSRNYLIIGDIVDLNGYYTAGDGAHHKRKIEATDDGSGVQLANGLWANIVHNGEVNVSWFGAKGDGVTDDTETLQRSIFYSAENELNLSGAVGSFKITDTLLIPKVGTRHKHITFDFKNAELFFEPNVNTAISSAVLKNGIYTQDDFSVVDNNMSFNFTIKNLLVRRVGVTDLNFVNTIGFRLKDFKQNCRFENLVACNFFKGFHSYSNYYSTFEDCMVFNDEQPGGLTNSVGLGFVFERQIALMTLKNLKAVNVSDGYTFKGWVSGTCMDSCSYEGQRTSVVTIGEKEGDNTEVLGLRIANGYIENVFGEIIFNFINKANVTIDNCFFNPETVGTFNKKYVFDCTKDSIVNFNPNNNLKHPLTEETISKNKGATKVKIELPSEYFDGDFSKISSEENGTTTIYEKYFIDLHENQNVKSITKKNNGMNISNFTGRMTSGSDFGGTHGVFNIKQFANKIEFDTKIKPSDSQLIYINFRILDANGIQKFRGFIVETEFNPISNSERNKASVTVYQAEGFVRVIVNQLTKPTGDMVVQLAEVRLI